MPVTIEWLSDNGSCYVDGDTRSFARDIGLEPRTTPLESPQSDGMAEAFVRTIKRDYVRVSPRPDAKTVMRQLPAWIAHYNDRTRLSATVHPVSSSQLTRKTLTVFGRSGATTDDFCPSSRIWCIGNRRTFKLAKKGLRFKKILNL